MECGHRAHSICLIEVRDQKQRQEPVYAENPHETGGTETFRPDDVTSLAPVQHW